MTVRPEGTQSLYPPGARKFAREMNAKKDKYFFEDWDGAEGSDVVVDLWSGAVGVVSRDSSEDCTTSGQQCVNATMMYLPELEAKTLQRFGWLFSNYSTMSERALKAGLGASSLQSLSFVPVLFLYSSSQLAAKCAVAATQICSP